MWNPLEEDATLPDADLHTIAKQYAWGRLSAEALKLLSMFARERGIIELGAGQGYHRRMVLEANQGRSFPESAYLAFDLEVWQPGDSKEQPWSAVQGGSVEQLDYHTGRAFYLSWPPRESKHAETLSFAFQALSRWTELKGEVFLYHGELDEVVVNIEYSRPQNMGCPRFFALLEEKWKLERSVEVPRWPGYEDELHLFYPRKA